MDAEDMEKKLRAYDQSVCNQLVFHVLSVHGRVDPERDELPTLLTVDLVPSSINRLLQAKEAVDAGVSLAGCSVRPQDLHTDLPDYALRGGRLLLSASGNGSHYHVEAQCFCRETDCFFSASSQITTLWFEEELY